MKEGERDAVVKNTQDEVMPRGDKLTTNIILSFEKYGSDKAFSNC